MRAIYWSSEASENLDQIVSYLLRDWSEKELTNFFIRLEKQLSIITMKPELYKKSIRKAGLHECQITNHNTLFYTFDAATVYIITVFDNRQNPSGLSKS